MDLSPRKSNANKRCNRDSTGRQQKQQQQLNYTSSNRRYVLLSLLSINRHQQSDSAAAPVAPVVVVTTLSKWNSKMRMGRPTNNRFTAPHSRK